MIDSVVFIKQDIEDVINYYLSISDSERIVENAVSYTHLTLTTIA